MEVRGIRLIKLTIVALRIEQNLVNIIHYGCWKFTILLFELIIFNVLNSFHFWISKCSFNRFMQITQRLLRQKFNLLRVGRQLDVRLNSIVLFKSEPNKSIHRWQNRLLFWHSWCKIFKHWLHHLISNWTSECYGNRIK